MLEQNCYFASKLQQSSSKHLGHHKYYEENQLKSKLRACLGQTLSVSSLCVCVCAREFLCMCTEARALCACF